MQYTRFENRIVFRLDAGDEIVDCVKEICINENILLGSVMGIGATDDAMVGIFEVGAKVYHSKKIVGDHEIVPLCGNITSMDGEVYLHLHINLVNMKNESVGGHLNSAIISATFEGVIDIIDGIVSRKKDNKTGLNLVSFE